MKELEEIKIDKIKISGQISNFDLNFKKEKQVARKWWYWPLNFLTCGMWESNNIKTINKKYSKDSYDKLVGELNMLDSKINNLESVIKTLESEIYKESNSKWKSLNNLN